MWRPEKSKYSPLGMEMAIVPSSTAMSNISRFRVPEDWVVEDRRRSSGKTAGLVDRSYYDPDTGLRFRSLRSVERYLAELKEKTPALKMLGFDKKEELLLKREMAIVAQSTTNITSSLNLPDGWVVEECIRTSGYSAGRVDKYYIEPGTGQKFRSLISVERHLAEVDGSSPTTKESKPDNRIVLLRRSAHAVTTYRSSSSPLPVDWTVKEVPRSPPSYADTIDKPSQKSRIQMKKVSDLMKKTSSFNSSKPPIKIKWVLSGAGGDTWSPFMGGSMVPDSVKQQWAKKFIFSVTTDSSTHKIPKFCS